MSSDNNSNLSPECNSTINQGHVEEFTPTSNTDPTLTELRHLFVTSFYEYYKTVEPQLNLPEGKSLLSWLEETFAEEADELLSHKCRCFLILTLPPSSVIAGFLTIKESKNDPNSIYISQCAVDSFFKRKGYGLLLLKHLTTIFSSATTYTCLCRRVNKPALNFYAKFKAKLIVDDEIATKYGYNPVNYLGFEFTSNQLHSQ